MLGANKQDLDKEEYSVTEFYHDRGFLWLLLGPRLHKFLSFPNFGHFGVRWSLAFGGRMPITGNLPDNWYNTPNIHLCTIHDFICLCEEINADIEDAVSLGPDGLPLGYSACALRANLLAPQAMFVLKKRQ